MNANLLGIITAVAAVFASSGLWQFILYKAQIHDKKHEVATKADIDDLREIIITKTEHEALVEQIERVERASLSTLHTNLYSLTQKVLRRGAIKAEEIEELDNIYEPYHALGGNGTGTNYYERAKNLPLYTKGDSNGSELHN